MIPYMILLWKKQNYKDGKQSSLGVGVGRKFGNKEEKEENLGVH